GSRSCPSAPTSPRARAPPMRDCPKPGSGRTWPRPASPPARPRPTAQEYEAAYAFSSSYLDDAGPAGIEPVDQLSAPLQRGALVDVALVGDLVAVDRGRLGHQEHAPDPRRGAGLRGVVRREPVAHEIDELRVGEDLVDVALAGHRHRRLHVRPGEQRDERLVLAADHAIEDHRRCRADGLRAKRADADPGAAVELEVLGHAA